MKWRNAFKVFSSSVALFAVLAPAVLGQKPPDTRSDEELKRISDLIDRAWSEVKEFRGAGGKDSDPENPGRKWSALLWEYRNRHPLTPAAIRATVPALNLILAAGQNAVAMAMIEALPPDDPAWDQVIQVLWRESEKKGDYFEFIKKVESIFRASREKNVRTRVGIFLGQAYWKKEQLDQAKAVFQAVIKESPDSDDAEWAAGNIYEITRLGLGQSSPPFKASALDGASISPQTLRGKIVLLWFWATW